MAKQLTMREIANKLINRGYSITYRNRKDGGILITSINGKTYKGAKGNTSARALVGSEAKLSVAREAQLKTIKPPKASRIKVTLPQALKDKLREVQDLYKKFKVPMKQGRLTQRIIKKIFKEEGLQSAYTKLERATKYAEGYATEATIQALIDYLKFNSALLDPKSQGLIEAFIADILINKDNIKDETIYETYKTLYDLGKRDTKDVLDEARIKLGISIL